MCVCTYGLYLFLYLISLLCVFVSVCLNVLPRYFSRLTPRRHQDFIQLCSLFAKQSSCTSPAGFLSSNAPTCSTPTHAYPLFHDIKLKKISPVCCLTVSCRHRFSRDEGRINTSLII